MPWREMEQRLAAAAQLPADSPPEDGGHASEVGMHPRRPLVVLVQWGGGDAIPTSKTWVYERSRVVAAAAAAEARAGDEVEWSWLEPTSRMAPSVLLGVPRRLIQGAGSATADDEQAANLATAAPARRADATSLLPTLSSESTQIKLPASLLTMAVRRSFCSTAPLLEACTALLAPRGVPHRGATFAMLSAVWQAMLVDASPFDAPADGAALGLAQLLVLSLVAKADPSWALPPSLARKVQAATITLHGTAKWT